MHMMLVHEANKFEIPQGFPRIKIISPSVSRSAKDVTQVVLSLSYAT